MKTNHTSAPRPRAAVTAALSVFALVVLGTLATAGADINTCPSSLDVNMGQVFALRPRVSTLFRPNDFREARRLLEGEAFADASEAARAVAEKALELSQDGAVPGRKKHQRRF